MKKKFDARLIGVALALAFLASGLLTLSDYGITVDSPENFLWGDIYLRYYETGNSEYLNFESGKNPLISYPVEPTHVFYYQNKYRPWQYPPAASILSAITHQIFHERLGWLGDIDAHHLAIIFLSSAAVLVLYLFVYDVYGWMPASTSALCLMFYPRFVAHSHNNVKDAPMAAFFVFTVYAFWLAVKTRKLRWYLASGILLGLALNVKVNAYFLPVMLGLWLLATYKEKATESVLPYVKKTRGSLKYGLRKTTYPSRYNFVAVAASALATVYLSWPYLWAKPLNRLLTALQSFSGAGEDIPVLYAGTLYEYATEVPATYAPHYLAIVTPPATLILALLGFLKAYSFLKKSGIEKSHTVLSILWFTVPLIKYVFLGVAVIDGIRHFLETVPALCVFAGLGALCLCEQIRPRLPRNRRPQTEHMVLAIILLSLLPTAYSIVSMHPYQIAYFNFLVGGVRGAEGDYEIAYWGTALRHAWQWVGENRSEGDGAIDPLWMHLSSYYADDINIPQENNYVTLLVDPTLYNMSWFPEKGRNLIAHLQRESHPVHEITVKKVPVVKIYTIDKDTLYTINGWNKKTNTCMRTC